jgi:hypothetical protein
MNHTEGTRVAPGCVQTIAKIFLFFGILSLLRSPFKGPNYLFIGLVLLAIGWLIPRLVIAVGLGVEPASDEDAK